MDLTALSVALHGTTWAVFLWHRGLQQAMPDFLMNNFFPHLDLDLHPITVHRT